jgi:protein ImuB
VAWHHDLRRIDGVDLPAWQRLELRTAQAVQGTAHLRRLLAERLARQRLAAPADRLALRSLQTAALPQDSASLLPPQGQAQPGEPWHQLVERLSARLGPQCVQVPEPVQDHRPERMQRWQPALQAPAGGAPALPEGAQAGTPWPAWLVRPPRPLALRGDRPCLHGQPLRLLAGPQRVEAGWWEAPGEAEEGLAQRDYFVAHGPEAGWVWVFRDRATGGWFLQGVYA